MTFEYLTPEDAANFTPEQAEWEEAALKREAATSVEMVKTATAVIEESTRLLEEFLYELRGRDIKAERPDLRLVTEEASDDA
jgi:hypothetical protein